MFDFEFWNMRLVTKPIKATQESRCLYLWAKGAIWINRSCKQTSCNTGPTLRRGWHHCGTQCPRLMEKQVICHRRHIEEIKSMGGKKMCLFHKSTCFYIDSNACKMSWLADATKKQTFKCLLFRLDPNLNNMHCCSHHDQITGQNICH